LEQRALLLVQAVVIVLAVSLIWLKPSFGDWLSRNAVALGVRWLAAVPRRAVAFVGVCGFLSSVLASVVRGVPVPYAGDELGYLLAADTFAQGRVTNPPPPQWQHFETLNTFFEPTYMSKFPPGQGLMLAVGQLIGGHPVVGVWLSMGLLCAAITWMLWAGVSPRWAVVGGLIAVFNLGFFSYWSASYWGGAVAGIGGSLLLGAILRFMAKPSDEKPLPQRGVAFLLGLGIVVLLISRPYEGLGYVVCCLLAVVLFWRKNSTSTPQNVRRIFVSALAALMVAAMGMGAYNARVTGEWKRLPYAVYEEQYGVAPVFLFQSPHPVPEYRHESFRTLYLGRDLQWYQAQQDPEGLLRMSVLKLRVSVGFFWGEAFLVPLLAFVLMVRRFPLGRGILLVLGGVLAASLLGVFWSPHYIAPLTGILILLPTWGLSALWHWKLQDKPIGRAIVCGVMASVLCIPAFSRSRILETPPDWRLKRAEVVRQLERQAGRDLVLVSYSERHNSHDEWVFNRADIPNADIVWARSMTKADNDALIAAYPNRMIWLLEPDAEPPKLTLYTELSPEK
jgi:hypothetical protein